MAVYYIFHKPNGKFGTMNLVDPARSGDLSVYDVIDFNVPKLRKKPDKTGYRNFLFALKAILFNNARERMTKNKCEGFFDDHRNFDFVKDKVKFDKKWLAMF